MFERLKAEGDRTPADVLLTVDAGNLWNAARAGLLSPVTRRSCRRTFPLTSVTPRTAGSGSPCARARSCTTRKRVNPAELSTYEALGDPRWKGRLCLRNRATSTTSHCSPRSSSATASPGPRRRQGLGGQPAHPDQRRHEDPRGHRRRPVRRRDHQHYYLARLLEKDPNFPSPCSGRTRRPPAPRERLGRRRHRPRPQPRQRGEAPRVPAGLEAQQMFADTSMEYPVNPRAEINPIVAGWGTFKQDDINIAAAGELQAAAARWRTRRVQVSRPLRPRRRRAPPPSAWTLAAVAIAAALALPLARRRLVARTGPRGLVAPLAHAARRGHPQHDPAASSGVGPGTLVLGTALAWLVAAYRLPGPWRLRVGARPAARLARLRERLRVPGPLRLRGAAADRLRRHAGTRPRHPRASPGWRSGDDAGVLSLRLPARSRGVPRAGPGTWRRRAASGARARARSSRSRCPSRGPRSSRAPRSR